MSDVKDFRYDCLNHGFVRVVDTMGAEGAIVQAARVSYGEGTTTPSDDRSLLRYLMRHRHTTPFEMCEIKLHVKLPIFVARQWIRHRTANVNEYSARYSILDGEFYFPDVENMQEQSNTNKQGRGVDLDEAQAKVFLSYLHQDAAVAYDHYQEMVGAGIYEDDGNANLAREIARMNLPANIYTQWYWKVDLHNLLHFLTLRCDPHAQYEIRVYANAIAEIVRLWVPEVWQAWQDYTFNAHTFSHQELQMLRALVRGQPADEKLMKQLSNRELNEFNKVLGLVD